MATHNPPAFPTNERMSSDGLSLRDYFAGQVISGLLATRVPPGTSVEAVKSNTVAAAYAIADAMLAERANP
jgi:hypothetical protein